MTLEISFCIKFFSTFITLDVFMACSMHIKLPLVFVDVWLRRAFSTITNELTIATCCLLYLFVVRQISLNYRLTVTIITTENKKSISDIPRSSILNPFRCLKMSNGEFYDIWQLKKSNGDRTKVKKNEQRRILQFWGIEKELRRLKKEPRRISPY